MDASLINPHLANDHVEADVTIGEQKGAGSMKKTELARRHELASERRKPVGHKALADFQFRLRHFLSFSEANTHKNGLTSQQYQALLTIRGLSGSESSMSVNKLASFLLINTRAAAGLVNRMVRTGLLRRFTDPIDGRRVLVGLTQKGKRKLANVAEANWRKLHSAGARGRVDRQH